MGTNFYWVDEPKEYKSHIGKRSAAGYYCWDCNLSLHKYGEDNVHKGCMNKPVATTNQSPIERLTAMIEAGKQDWHKACPKCKKKIPTAKEQSNAGMVELGFNKPKETRPTGVASTSSFTWAQKPDQVMREIKKGRKIVDEYGRKVSGAAFLKMLDQNCAIRFYHSVGQEFS